MRILPTIAALALALALAIATPALAQSTVVMPLPGANGYAVIPPRQGFTTQVLPMPGGGWLIVPPLAAQPALWLPKSTNWQALSIRTAGKFAIWWGC
jgi:hypothetical protein